MSSTTTLAGPQKRSSTRGTRNGTRSTSVKTVKQLDLAPYGITVKIIHRNPSPPQLYEHAIRYEPGSSIADSGALIAYSGLKTGRSPLDNGIEKPPASEGYVWWGTVNTPIHRLRSQVVLRSVCPEANGQ